MNNASSVNSRPVHSEGPTYRLQVDLRDLLRGSRELLIVHQGRTYCLRLTRNDKLILTC